MSKDAGLLIALFTTLSWTIGIFPFTIAAQKLGSNSVNHFRLLLAVLVLGILTLVLSNINLIELFSLPGQEQWFWLGLSGLVGLSIGDYFSFSAFVLLGPGMGSLFATLAPAAALIAGYLLLGEKIDTNALVGMSLTLAGILWISAFKQKSEIEFQKNNTKGILFGIGAALCQGLGLVFAKKGMTIQDMNTNISAIHFTWMRMFSATFLMYMFSFFTRRLAIIHQPIFKNKEGGMKYLLWGTLFGPVIGVTLSLYTVKLIEVSIAQTLFSLVPAFALLISRFYYKEKISPPVLFGFTIALAGVFVLIWL
jgi:drug/metabolite transporter (DMT)-like permease